MPGHRHQSLAGLILTGQRFDLAGEPLDPLIQPAPVSCQVLDDAQHARREDIGARREDNPKGIEPVLEMFTRRRLEWAKPLDLPQFENMPS